MENYAKFQILVIAYLEQFFLIKIKKINSSLFFELFTQTVYTNFLLFEKNEHLTNSYRDTPQLFALFAEKKIYTTQFVRTDLVQPYQACFFILLEQKKP